jgi:hypothetical protein
LGCSDHRDNSSSNESASWSAFVDNLPSSEAGGLASGVADIAFIGNTMYAILGGAGCSHGAPSIPNAVIRINPDHRPTIIADLGAFLRTHPVANPTDPVTGDFEPDGTWYSMIALRGDLYAIEPNHGELDKITTEGKITRAIDISASQGHVVPTVVGDHGVFYVSNLGRFDPDQLNTQDVFQITPSGQLKVVATGLSKVLGLAFDERHCRYVLETAYSTSSPGPVPATGRLICILPNGHQQLLIDSTLDDPLFFPTGLTFGPDGSLYISNFGFGLPDGQILKVELKDLDANCKPRFRHYKPNPHCENLPQSAVVISSVIWRWQNPDANRLPEGISMDHEVEAFELLIGCQPNNQRAGSVRYAGIERRGWGNSHTITETAPVEPIRAGRGIQSEHVFPRFLGVEHEVTVPVGLGCLVRRVV